MNEAPSEQFEPDARGVDDTIGSLPRLAMTVVLLSMYHFSLTMLNDDSPWCVWAVLAIVGYAVFVYRLFREAPATAIVLLPLLVISGTQIASCAAIESGAWMEEISQAGAPTGGTARLAITLMAFFSVGACIVEPAWSAQRGQPIRDRIQVGVNRIALPTTVACWFFIGYLVYVGLRKGFPIFSGTDRFDFMYQLADPMFVSLLGNSTLFVTGLSLMAAVPATRYRAWILFVGIIVLQILFGEKFTLLIVPTAVFAAAGLLVYLSRHGELPIIRITWIGVMVTGLTMFTSLNYYASRYGSFEIAKTKLIQRMAEQGEMWYVGDRDFRHQIHIEWPIVSQDVAACLGWRSQNPKDIQSDFGPFVVIKHYGNESQFQVALERNVYFAFTYSPYWMMISGYLGFACVSFLTSVAYGVAGRLYLVGLVQGNLFGALLSQKAMFWVYSATVVGWTFLALGYKTVIVLFAAWTAIHYFRVRTFVTEPESSR